jgi:DNA-binding NarL/FixJ family response regulator
MVAIVDDDEAFRLFLSEALRLAGFESVEFASGEDLLRSPLVPDVVVLDVKLGGISGYEVCRVLRGRFGERMPIIFVSGSRREAHDRVAGLMIGSDEYLVKPIMVDELVARIHRLQARVEPAHRTKANGGGHSGNGADVAGHGAHPHITTRELEVLRLLAEGKTQQDIASDLFISPHTVATHIQRLLEKLGARSRAEAVALAYRLGLVSA